MSSESSANAAEQRSDATICTSGAASANSGGNSAVGGVAGEGEGRDEHDGVSSTASVSEGDAKAQGVIQSDKVTQTAWVAADETSQVDVLQVALVINIGFAIANTAGNSATGVSGQSDALASSGGASAMGTASAQTGSALGAGVVSSTRILQAAVVRSQIGEDNESVENVLVINLGEGTANTGLNKIIGVLSEHGEDYGIGGAAGSASVQSGGATAVGVASSTLINQSVQAQATNGAFIVITQRGVVFNIGGAISNTGFNSATGVGELGLTADQLAALTSLYQVLNALLEAGGWALPADGGAGGRAGTAVGDAHVSSGDALAVGVDAATTIIQDVNATADGGTIDASQSAVVANVGLGVANTGANHAAGVAGGASDNEEESEELAQTVLSPAAQALADFLLALSAGAVAPDGTTTVAGLFDFGSLIASLTGFAEVTDSLAATSPSELNDGEETASALQTKRVRVRQVVGVLTFAFASANGEEETESFADVDEVFRETDQAYNSVANSYVELSRETAEKIVDGTSTFETESVGDPPDPSTFEADVTGTATIETGDAVAANVDRTRVCQVHNVDPEICAPKVIRWIVNPGVRTVVTRSAARVEQVTVPNVAAPAPVAVPSGVRVAIVDADEAAVRGESLPVTGADSADHLTIAWSVIGAGMFLVLVAAFVPRRRATG